ncbi:hypothetical protein [Alkalihalobacillus sp. LMS39]|uniref:hypothetical protein n=1 Tax=Alkalihalobacillus sp. LMS39 TaxID=2924032 RepID=UPI001FB42D6A|nr:hypothetical protein [Alkalihalobacillus sp. LMS39]UOE95224.1 hypothetical protein MM271_06280 [Alkalihalobacillus sp. LMS39]
MFNKEKEMKRWERTRKLGVWKYIFLYGLLVSGAAAYFTRFLLNNIRGGNSTISDFLMFAIPFGLLYGIISWFSSESRYKKYIGIK